jgi:MoaA/NifB/PqqE/SkfB family radical SAM enzyme
MPTRNVPASHKKHAPLQATVQVDPTGHLTLPPAVTASWHLRPGDRLSLALNGRHITVTRGPHHLVKLYVEPTTVCNLNCRTCMRNTWETPDGHMAFERYERLLAQAKAIPTLERLAFGGFGEPLAHPRLPEMVARAKAQGLVVELVTNGTLLDPDMALALVRAGLDQLWVSIDGVTPETYNDVRGERLQIVLDHLRDLRRARRRVRDSNLELGLVFVAMKHNAGELAQLPRLAGQVGARQVMVTNVLPYTDEMAEEMLYERALFLPGPVPASVSPQVILPNMDWDQENGAILVEQLSRGAAVRLMDQPLRWSRDTCRFIAQGCAVIGWDGRVAPCLGLLHPYTTYLHGYERHIRAYSLGHIDARPLDDIWSDPEYVAFRERVDAFEFSPCTICGGCDDFESNETDCVGSPFPACGGCLWAQGVIQCP